MDSECPHVLYHDDGTRSLQSFIRGSRAHAAHATFKSGVTAGSRTVEYTALEGTVASAGSAGLGDMAMAEMDSNSGVGWRQLPSMSNVLNGMNVDIPDGTHFTPSPTSTPVPHFTFPPTTVRRQTSTLLTSPCFAAASRTRALHATCVER